MPKTQRIAANTLSMANQPDPNIGSPSPAYVF
jgi:hypothetical protein